MAVNSNEKELFMKIGSRNFDFKQNTYVMGILNVTPDSFSDGGKYRQTDAALRHAEQMIADGADIIDIGGESTRPGHTKVSEAEETARVAPVIEAVKTRFDVPVSLDTYKAKVAAAGLAAGADLINDIWGLREDPGMSGVIAKAKVPCCLMHNRSKPGYRDLMRELCEDLRKSAAIAKQAGIADDKIILDPGIGFGKTYGQNLAVLKRLGELKCLGYPILLGASRKSVIGLTLDIPADERVTGTAVTTVFAVLAGCAFVRVHDVKENVRAIRMTRAIMEAEG